MVDLLNDKRRPYQCAYRLWQMRMYPEWNEDFWNTHGGAPPHKGEPFNDDDVVFLQDTYIVTKGTYYNKNVIWPKEKVNDDWIGYCQDVLEFKPPEWLYNDENWKILTPEEKQKLRDERDAKKKAKIAAAPHIMAAYDVVPDIIDSFEEKVKVKVTYKREFVVQPEPPMSESQVMEKPDISYSASNSSFHTLMLVDPDSPASWGPKTRSWRHWLVGNIVGDALQSGLELSSYVPPGPPTGSGLHRYVFLLFKQPSGITFDKLDDERGNFDVKAFAQKYKLELIGGTLFHIQAAKYK